MASNVPPEPPQPDAYSPIVLKIAPDGSITYDFDGHVHAQGLDLDMQMGGGPVAGYPQVRWLRPDGSVGANAWARDSWPLPGGGADYEVQARPLDKSGDLSLHCTRQDGTGWDAGFDCIIEPTGIPGQRRWTQTNISALGAFRIMDDEQGSDWVQQKEWRGKAYRLAAYNLPAGVYTNIPLDTVDYDVVMGGAGAPAAQWDAANSQWIIRADGIYRVTGQVCMQAAAGAAIDQGISFTFGNPANQFAQDNRTKAAAALFQSVALDWEGPLVTGQTIKLAGYLTGGSPLAQLANKGTYLAIRRVGK